MAYEPTATNTASALRTVAEVARLAGITVRTLHHYDELGLLVPSARSDAGYRLYADADIARLQDILVARRLGIALRDVEAFIAGPHRIDVLRRQLDRVRVQQDDLAQLEQALTAALAASSDHQETTMHNVFDALDGFDPTEHEDEARERWGHTAAYAQSHARTKQYGPTEWLAIKEEAADIVDQLHSLWSTGMSADEQAARDLAEAHRAHIARWFYDCSLEIHRGLGEMYVADPRFTAYWEGDPGTQQADARAGFAAWVRDAFAANADARS